ncbi:MAG: hypothetical protein KGI84_01735, partial [Elusimicrobia bacterium]|nr:hypothetical protein [Elusimicrobiota bacterium]
MAAFQSRWLKKFSKLERSLRGRSGEGTALVEHITMLDRAAKSVFAAPGLGAIFLQQSLGSGVRVRAIQSKGGISDRDQNLDFSGGTLTGVHYDEAERSVILVGHTGREYALEKRPVDQDGKIGKAEQRISFSGPADALGTCYDAASRNLIVVGGENAEILNLSAQSPELRSEIRAPGSWSGAAYDEGRSILYLANADGKSITAWNLSQGGVLSQGPETSTSHPIETLIFNPADQTLLGYDRDARRYEIFSAGPDGRVADEEKSITFPMAASGRNVVALSPSKSGAI